ncbi:MAG TPA: tetratricopeptide repeat protein [Chthoniobacterales bacterium]
MTISNRGTPATSQGAPGVGPFRPHAFVTPRHPAPSTMFRTQLQAAIFVAAGLAFSGFWCFPGSVSSALADNAQQPRRNTGVGDVTLSFQAEKAKPDLVLSKDREHAADALASFVRGLMNEDDGNINGALEAYEKVLSLDPSGVDPKLAARVASEYARRGDVAEGIGLLKDIIKAQPKEPLPYVTAAFLYLRQLNKPDLAEKYARQAVQVAPYDLRSLQALFSVLDAKGDTILAEKALDEAAKLDSEDPDFWFGLGDLYLRIYARDNTEDRMTGSERAKVGAIYQKALAQGENSPVVLSRVADFYSKTGDIQTAIPLYLKAIAENSGASETLQTDVRERLAQVFLNQGKRKEAIEMLEGLVKLNPLKTEAYLLLGEIYESSKDYESALANFQQALLTKQNDPRTYLLVARTALRLKRPFDAVKTLIDARSRFASPEITTWLAIAYSQADKLQESLTTFEEAIQESKNYDQDILNSNFYLSYAETAQKAGLYEKTVSLIRKSIDMDPSNAHQGQNFLGYFWVDRGENLEEGAQLIRKALSAEPDNGAYIDSLGWYYYKKGNYDAALKELLRATEHLPEEDAVVYEHIGDTYLKKNQLPEALDYWQRALRLDPNNKTIAGKIEAHNEKVTVNKPAPSGKK